MNSFTRRAGASCCRHHLVTGGRVWTFLGLAWTSCVLLGFLLIAGWWSTLRPKRNRDWQPQVTVLAYATREGDQVAVQNIRNFEYRTATDFTPRYETRTYSLANLRELNLFINYWGSKLIAHPILSFDIGPQCRLCFSIETHFARGEGYSLLPGSTGSMRSFTSAADERYVVRLRTNFKHEELYLYRILMPPQRSAGPVHGIHRPPERIASSPSLVQSDY